MHVYTYIHIHYRSGYVTRYQTSGETVYYNFAECCSGYEQVGDVCKRKLVTNSFSHFEFIQIPSI